MTQENDNSIHIPSEEEVRFLVTSTLTSMLKNTNSCISADVQEIYSKEVSKIVLDLIETMKLYHDNNLNQMFSTAYHHMDTMTSPSQVFGDGKNPLFVNVPIFIPLSLLSLFLSVDQKGGAIVEGIIALTLYLQKHIFYILNYIISSNEQLNQRTQEMKDKGYLN